MLPARRLCATTGLEALEEVHKLELADTFTFCLDHANTHGFSLILEGERVTYAGRSLNSVEESSQTAESLAHARPHASRNIRKRY